MGGQFHAQTGSFNRESIEPGPINFPEAAVLGGDVQPLIDKGLQRDVALQPIGLLGEVERLVRMHRAEHARVLFLLIAGLGRVRHHQVGVALGDFVENRDVVVPHLDLGVLDVRFGKAFIGAAGIDDDARAGLVDIGDGLILVLVGAAGDRRLAFAHDRRREHSLLLPVERDRDAAHRDIEIVGFEILHQLWPSRLNELDLDAERLAKRFRHVDVEAAEFRGGLVEIGERLIVAGHADPQRAALDDVVETGVRRLSVGDNGPQDSHCKTNEHSKHQVFSADKLGDTLEQWRRFKPDIPVAPPGEIEIVTVSLYEASVGVFVPYLGNLSGLLDQASAYAEARNIDPAVLLNMRLSPTMYSLKQQVGEANRHAVVAGGLLAGRAPHTFSDSEPDIGELKARISAAIDFVQGLPRAEIEAAADKEVAFTFKNGAQRKFTGKSLLLTFSVPQFFFHVTTAYDILRHAGVDLAKKDFLGPPR